MNSETIVRMALTQLAYYLAGAHAFRCYAETEDNSKVAGIYYRKALKRKTEGLVEHDRILVKAWK